MKKILAVVVVLMAVALVGAGAAMAGVSSTKHNLSSGSSSSYSYAGTDEICVFCHTPHNAVAGTDPLWNRTTSSTGFTMYGTTQAGTYINPTGAPSAITVLCFSCHDGTSALNVLSNFPGSTTSVGANTGGGGDTLATSYAALGKDLSNDHPVGMRYGLVGGLNAIGTVVAGQQVVKVVGGVLEGDSTVSTVECSSCHNPHDATNPSFLRSTNANSALCLVCHNK